MPDYGKPYQAYITIVILELTPFQIVINRWSESLSKQVAIYREANRKVYIIALSRKMPRFFDWLEKEVSTPEVNRLLKDLKSNDVEIITEYAVPLILDNHPVDDIRPGGIIADDAIIFGATANKVAMQWLSLSGEVPILSALFRSDRGIISKTFESEYSIGMSRMSFDNLSKNMTEISRNIIASSLPVDMEYPIIHIRKSYEEVKDFIKKSIPSEWRSYTVESSVNEISNESFTVLLGDGVNDGYTNDFAKVRLFKQKDECCIEIISPTTIRVDSLYDSKLFLNRTKPDDAYNELWKYVHDKLFATNDSIEKYSKDDTTSLSRNANHALLSTLTIWAEYLISFSTFIRYKKYLLPDANDMHIDETDLRLILGEISAKYAIEKLRTINYTCHLNNNQSTDVAFEGYYISSPEPTPNLSKRNSKDTKPQ